MVPGRDPLWLHHARTNGGTSASYGGLNEVFALSAERRLCGVSEGDQLLRNVWSAKEVFAQSFSWKGVRAVAARCAPTSQP